jgi:hypothetical protein
MKAKTHIVSGGGITIYTNGTLAIDDLHLKDIEACRDAARALHWGVLLYHGPQAADKLFKAYTSKRYIKDGKNIVLLLSVVR